MIKYFLLGFLVFVTAFAFSQKTIKVGNQALKVELAITQQEQEKGLMYRKQLSEKEGMLFIFDEERIANFWMKNTLIPLSIGFFDKDKILFQIEDMQPASAIEIFPPTTKSKKLAKYALEVNQGWFKKNKIKIGSKLSL